MKAVILCGGKGTRLREETEYRPKPLVPIGGKPILWHIMKLFSHYGIHDFVCCLGYRGDKIKEYFINYEAMGQDFTIDIGPSPAITYHGRRNESNFRVTLADTGEENLTGSRIRQIKKYVDDDLFIVTYGDGVTDLDIRKLIKFHRAHGRLATVTTVNPISRFAHLKLDQSGKVERYKEKPHMHSWISVGFFVFDRRIFDYLRTDPTCILEKEPLERLTRERQLMAYRHNGFFYAMDTYRDYTLLNHLWEKKRAPWAVWERSWKKTNWNFHVPL
ncbi:MAG: glucose-1-phosphate cytidylyltransferase [Candidatus Peribacteraceae bacterium]|jgi:glucose-1-phosphate cytidylyltransferase|nr:glucose-1-phosphate cytidylyltransferase [Candidatus Peribacteraceae bacterium]